MTIDVLFCSVPYIETDEPVMAPAVLKGALADSGLTVATADLNIEVLRKIRNSPVLDKMIDFFLDQKIDDETLPEILEIIEYCTQRILSYNPKTLGVSLLTFSCQIFTRWLLVHIRSIRPEIRIVIGGTGIKAFIADPKNTFCEKMREDGLIDDFISGDGEVAVQEYFKDNMSYPGINTMDWQPNADLDQMPWADYDDYDFSLYNNPAIPIVDSRGCIKKCEFCDVIQYWKKYQYRSAETTFKEILYQTQRHGVTRISIRNSLTNGNMVEFGKLVKCIAEYNGQRSTDDQLSWIGFFIVRSQKLHSEELWKNISESNGSLMLGVESVIERVRYQMGKKFKDEDLEYHLSMGKAYSVPLILMMIISYPTETLADYEYTKQWFKDHAEYAGDSISALYLAPAAILPGTELEHKTTEYGVSTGKYPSIWINQNLGISTEDKIKYHEELADICEHLGFNVVKRDHTLKTTKEHANS